ncbi:MAG: glycoside hydrolase family 3 protein [Elusimicrobiota bacterium]|jgi:beta-N-acetylhexosaminidase|nr:glycoside hydrolase family 3 protein [Elusimicrobiota bacterium]
MKKTKIILLALFFACFAGALTAQQGRMTKPKARQVQGILSPVPQDQQANIKIKDDALEALPQARDEEGEISFESLSLAEKLAQTIVIATDIDTADRYRPAIERGLVGGVLIQWGDYSLAQTKNLVDKLQRWAQKSPSKIPLLIAIDYEGGTVYTPVTLGFPYLPTNMMLAAADNTEDTISLFFIVAQELKNVGVHINFAPVLDVNINPANPIIGVRSFGSDTELVGNMGLALITGMQKAGIMAVAKHFPGHGETIVDSHLDLPRLNMTAENFEKIHLPPFRRAIESGVMGVMTAHIVYNFIDESNPATFSPKILGGLLREKLGFKGLVISDSLDMAGALKSGTIADAAARALSSGVDMVLTSKRNPELTHRQIMAQINKTIPRQNIEDAAKKIFELKRDMGLFAKDKERSKINSSLAAFNHFADKITRDAVTIVKAEEGTLPYTKAPADGAEEKRKKVCTIFFSPPRFADQLPVINVPFLEKGWQADYYNARMRPGQGNNARIQQCMRNADLVLLGSMQWADKPIASQRAAIRELLKSDKDIILLSLMSPYDIKFYPEAKNVIALYGANKFSVRAAADIILGNIDAKGRLPVKM